MGKWFSGFARKGAVGGTARHVADWYKVQIMKADAMGMNPDKMEDTETAEVCRSAFIANLVDNCITARTNAGVKSHNDHALISLVRERQITDLLGLTLAILVCEAQFAKNDPENQIEFLNIVVEELAEQGVPEEYMCGGELLRVLRTGSEDVYVCLLREYRDIMTVV